MTRRDLRRLVLGQHDLVRADLAQHPRVDRRGSPGNHLPNPHLLRENHEQQVRLEIVPDRRHQSIDLVHSLPPQLPFVGRVELNGQGHVVLDVVDAIHVRIDGDHFRPPAREVGRHGSVEESKPDNRHLHTSPHETKTGSSG